MPTSIELSPKTLQQAILHYSEEQSCITDLAAIRWPNGEPVCPACEHRQHWYLKAQRRWKCKECGKQFSVKVNSIFEDSRLPLNKWMVAFWMVANCKNGVSSYEIHRAIGVTQKSAWFMLHRIRHAMQTGSIEKFGATGGTIEADETFVGANIQKMHQSRRAKMQGVASNTYGMNRHAIGKTIVMGMLDRDLRKVRAMVIPNVKRATLQEQILNHVAGGSRVVTDDATGYRYALSDGFAHEIINHAQEYVRGHVHTQGIENFWSLLKRTLRGTYVAVEPFHLDRYITETMFRYNNRGHHKQPIGDGDRFKMLLSQVIGKHITYDELTGKENLPMVGTEPN
jgi:transposase-like protein